MSQCNKNASSSSVSDLYDRKALYSCEDILNVCKAEDAEQQRRIADVEGENHKRVLANNLAVMWGENVRATWFQRGSSFVLSLLSGVRSAVAHKASDITTAVSDKAGDLGHKAALRLSHTAEDVGLKAQEAAFNASNAISNKSAEVGFKAQEKAHQLSDQLAHKAEETAHNLSSSVSSQAHTAALNIKEKSLETAHSVSSLAQEKASDLKSKGFESVQSAKSLFQEYTIKLKDALTSMSIYKKLGNLTGHTNITFALLEEENERAHRMNSSSEKYAIENALKISAMIKEHNGIASSDPYAHFSSRLLEEAERARRICEAQSDKAALDNARTISNLIVEKSSSVENLKFQKDIKKEIKQEFAEKEVKKPFAAAM